MSSHQGFRIWQPPQKAVTDSNLNKFAEALSAANFGDDLFDADENDFDWP